MRMPGMDGLELLKIVGEKYPYVVKMVLSGYAPTSDLMKALYQEGAFQFVSKPWQLDDGLKGLVRKALDHYPLQSENRAMVVELDRRKTNRR